MSIYHLHIPRTSGVFIREVAIQKSSDRIFAGHRQELPESFSEYEIVSGHFGTTPIKDTDVNFAMFRNPVDLTFSYINYLRDNCYPELSLSKLIKKYIDNGTIESFVNINSKFLTGSIDISKYNKNITDLLYVAENCWFIKNFSVDFEHFVETVQNNKTILVDFDSNDKYEKIGNILGTQIVGNKINQSSEIDPEALYQYNNLITDLNSFDLEVYDYVKKQAI
jgi:hypothetical protein